MPLSQGQVLDNRYRVVKLLGQGGFGTVYRIWDTRFGRPLALKENLDTAPNAQRQFKREAQILYDLSHPNLPRVIDHFVIPDQGQYLVMEYADGEDFREMLEGVGGPLSETQALEWIGQVCNALEYLHTQNPPIIHRDIKPANIKITPDGKAILVDFGIAKVYDPNLSTTVGARAVTPGYSPQEQYGQGNTDARTDVYALGATLYHILTGVQPPESVLRTMGMELEEPQKLNSAISDNVEEAILKAMEPLPEKRFQNIAKFKEALMTASMTGVSQKAPATMIAQKGPSLMTRPAVVSSQPAVMPKPLSRKLPWKWIGVSGVLVLVTLVSLGVIISLLTANGGGPDVDSDSTQTAIALGFSNTLMAPVTATDPPESSPEDTPVVVEVVVTEGIPDVGFEIIPGGFLEKAIAGEYAGSEVTIDGPYMDPDPDQQHLLESVAAFEDATGIKVNYIGDREFEARCLQQ